MKDYYKILGVSDTAEIEVITAAYRALMRKYHPDTNPSPSSGEKAKEINEAYEVLRDAGKRRNYDQQRQASKGGQSQEQERARQERERERKEQAERQKREQDAQAREQQERERQERVKREREQQERETRAKNSSSAKTKNANQTDADKFPKFFDGWNIIFFGALAIGTALIMGYILKKPSPIQQSLADNSTDIYDIKAVDELRKDFLSNFPADGYDSQAADAFEKRDFAQLSTFAVEGNAAAQRMLGLMYAEGEGVAEDDVSAVTWFIKAAEQGDAAAQRMLGLMYARGEGVAEDDASAVIWSRRAAEQGDAVAQLNLGAMFFIGEGVPKDDAAAFIWFSRAAEQGNAVAQLNLGAMLLIGKGVPKDDAAAFIWFSRAAEQGNATAQKMLGVIYEEGERVTQDYVQAYKWFNLSVASYPAGSDRDDAKEMRESIGRKMQPAQIAEAQRLSSAWRKK
jgi:TPR repeat protein